MNQINLIIRMSTSEITNVAFSDSSGAQATLPSKVGGLGIERPQMLLCRVTWRLSTPLRIWYGTFT